VSLMFVLALLGCQDQSNDLELHGTLLEKTLQIESYLGGDSSAIHLQLSQLLNQDYLNKDDSLSVVVKNWLYSQLQLKFNLDRNNLAGILPSQVLRQKQSTCVGTLWLAILYAQQQHLPLKAVYMPGHIYMKIKTGSQAASYLASQTENQPFKTTDMIFGMTTDNIALTNSINLEPNRSGYTYTDSIYRMKYPKKYPSSYYQKELSDSEFLAVILYTLGGSFMEGKQYQKARTFYQLAIQEFPSFVEARVNNAISLYHLGDQAEAKELLQQISHPIAQMKLGEM
jgi:tetratricopeptide (TPR) repeat protein